MANLGAAKAARAARRAAAAGQRVWAGLVPEDAQGRARGAARYDVSHRQLLKLAYSTFDVDGDGELEKDEVAAMLGALGFGRLLTETAAQQFVQELFEKYDKDGNGLIEFEEFEVPLTSSPGY